MHPFNIALHKELDKEKVCPSAAYIKGLRWIGDVRHVEHEFDQKFLVFGVMWLETWVCHSGAKIPKLLEVLFHVSI